MSTQTNTEQSKPALTLPAISLISASRPTTLVYEYGVRIDRDAIDLSEDQFQRAHHLYNEIIARIREIVEASRAFCSEKSSPAAKEIDAQIAQLTDSFKAAKAADNEDEMKRIATARRELWAQQKPLMAEVRNTHKLELIQRFYSRISKSAGGELHALKIAAVSAGLGGDSAEDVITSALQAHQKSKSSGGMPHFRRADEIVQQTLMIAAHRGGGVPVTDITDGSYRPVSVSLRGDYRRRVFHGFQFRAGSAVSGKWISGTIEMHRALPTDAGVAEIRLKRTRVGQHYRWHLQFICVLSKTEKSVSSTVGKKPLVAVHCGWAARDDGRVVAGIAHSQDVGSARLYSIAPDVERLLDRAAALQSERDLMLNTAYRGIRSWLTSIVCDTLDPVLMERVQRMVNTTSFTQVAPHRLHKLIAQLQRAGYAQSDASQWADTDRKMWRTQAFSQRKALMRRRYEYRQLACELASNYEACVLTDLDLKTAAMKVDEFSGEKTEFSAKARAGRVRAALSEFRSAIINAFSREGGVVLASAGANVARTCSVCQHNGGLSDVDKDPQQQQCPGCGERYARKANAATNLFALTVSKSERVGEARIEAAELALKAANVKAERLKKQQDALRKKRELQKAETECEVAV
jgi:hypothetical protein